MGAVKEKFLINNLCEFGGAQQETECYKQLVFLRYFITVVLVFTFTCVFKILFTETMAC